MPKIILTRGIPASGKTTWARKMAAESNGRMKRVAKDDLWFMLGGHYLLGNELFLTNCRDKVIDHCLFYGFVPIVDEMFIHVVDIEQVIHRFPYADVVIEEFRIPVEECILRDSYRENPLGRDAILAYAELLAQEDERG